MEKKKLRKKGYKEGDSMGIHGVKYHPRKIEKGDGGLSLFQDPLTKQTYYMDENAPFDEEGYRTSYTDLNRSNPGKTAIGLSNLNVEGKRGNLKDRLYGIGRTQDIDWLTNDPEAIKIARGLNDLLLQEALGFNTNNRFKRYDTPKYNEGVYDKDAQDFIENDIVRRIRTYNPQISEESIKKLINALKNGMVSYGGPDTTFKTGKALGYTNISTGKVELNPFGETNLTSTIIHELMHYLRQANNSNLGDKTGYTDEETEKLKNAYNLNGYQHLENDSMPEFRNLSEIGVSNTQLRLAIKDKFNVPQEQLDAFINNLPEKLLLKVFRNLNGYTNYMYKKKQYNVDAMRKALIEVAMNDNNSNKKLLAKNGAKIHIKKKNRGKFTEYCGGNVTLACIDKAKRSGNKTLKKRAVFAENARHFKHKDGWHIPGVIDSNPNLDNMKGNYKDKNKWKNTHK